MILNLLDRMKLPFRKNKEFLSVLYDILGFYPHNIEVYRIAFSHKSLAYHREDKPAGKDRRNRERRYRNTDSGQKPLNNERLEYLGDAVLETIVSDILFRHYPQKREGFLTSTRSKIVQRETLNRLALDLGLEKLIRAAEGTNMAHTNIAGNAFEALMGAIYLDRGYKHCHWFISNRVIGSFIDLDSMAHKEVNFKSKLLEWSQKNRINIDFRDHAGDQDGKGFRCVISLEGIVMGRGNGRSKKESQQLAAKEVLTLMRRDAAIYDSIFRAKEKRTAMEAEESFALPKIDEIEESLNQEQKRKGPKDKAKTPVLEEKKTRTPRLASDEAYDTAYDEQAEYEVIDKEPEQPRLTAADYAAKGLPLPPTEDDAAENEPKPKRSRNRNRKERTEVEVAAKEKTTTSLTEKETKVAPETNDTVPDNLPTPEPEVLTAATETPARETPAETEQWPEAAEEAVETKAEAAVETVHAATEPQPTEPQPNNPQPTEQVADDMVPDNLEEVADSIQKEIAADDQPEMIIVQNLPPVDAPEADDKPEEPMADETNGDEEAANEEAAEEAEEAEEAADENADNETEQTVSTPASLDNASPKPILRHLSLDDFVFDVEQQELTPFDLNEADEAPTVRKPNRRRRRPARKPAAEQEAQPAEQQAERKQTEGGQNRQRCKKAPKAAPQPADADAPEKTAKPRRRRRRPAPRNE